MADESSRIPGLGGRKTGRADALLKAGRYACAYYISGYAIECALKACIARKTNQDDFPPRDVRRGITFMTSRSCWKVLASVPPRTTTSGGILAAINDPRHGVLQMVKKKLVEDTHHRWRAASARTRPPGPSSGVDVLDAFTRSGLLAPDYRLTDRRGAWRHGGISTVR